MSGEKWFLSLRYENIQIGKNFLNIQGDSGGPLLLLYGKNRIQIGITSFGATCAENDRNLPPGFAKIADNLDWINGVISGKH